jgi:hypothetical protein
LAIIPSASRESENQCSENIFLSHKFPSQKIEKNLKDAMGKGELLQLKIQQRLLIKLGKTNDEKRKNF